MKIAHGEKCNLQFTTKELNYYMENCGFTDEEKDILLLRARGKTILQIAFIMEEKRGRQYSLSTAERRIRKIKQKINKVTGN